ncbi:hypothetical protein AB0758_45575 [Tolypothrix bouteillei VB521301_2]|uniref:hypothetical protein n=1 Tax=Tolypothrix bouteillei TaxID=1246981 RepID=UPI0038B5F497
MVTNQLKDKAPIKQGERIVATGTLRQFVIAKLERDYNFAFDPQLRKQLEADYNTKPVLIVEGIYQHKHKALNSLLLCFASANSTLMTVIGYTHRSRILGLEG